MNSSYDDKALQRFFMYIEDYSDPNKCWIWTGGLTTWGYGRFSYRQKTVRAHKWIYEYHNGKVKEGLQLDHTCRVKACVNYLHLEEVDQPTNTVRGELYNRNKTHCKHGHEFTEDNTYWRISKWNGYRSRGCKRCNFINWQKRTKNEAVGYPTRTRYMVSD